MRFANLSYCVVLSIWGASSLGCGPSSSRETVSQVSSPDDQMVATLIEINGGATASYGYDVELGPKVGSLKTSVAHLYGATRNEQAYGVNLKWTGDRILTIECLKLKGTPEVQNPVLLNGRTIQVLLRTGVEDQSAPSGGMGYNLHKDARQH